MAVQQMPVPTIMESLDSTNTAIIYKINLAIMNDIATELAISNWVYFGVVLTVQNKG